MLSEMLSRLRPFARDFENARARHPYAVPLVAGLFGLLAIVPLVVGLWGATQIFTGLPDEAAIGRMGEMDQATAVYDAADRLVFTIYKERRMEVGLDKVSPNLDRKSVV